MKNALKPLLLIVFVAGAAVPALAQSRTSVAQFSPSGTDSVFVRQVPRGAKRVINPQAQAAAQPAQTAEQTTPAVQARIFDFGARQTAASAFTVPSVRNGVRVRAGIR